MKHGHVDGGGSPSRGNEQNDPQLRRPGPVPLEDDSWDADTGWQMSDSRLDESDRYHGQRRAKPIGAKYRWWIGGAAAGVASIATIALIMAPSIGAGGRRPTVGGPAAVDATSNGLTGFPGGDLPVGAGSVPVGQPTTTANSPTDDSQPPFALTIEAESGSPMVILTGSAAVESDDRASGRQIVTKLGNSNDGAPPGAVQIVGINLPSAGTYRFSIHYLNRDDTNHSSAVITVSGTEPATINFPGNKNCCGARTIEVPLSAGSHHLTITNASGPAPSIDKIVISRV